MSTSLDLSLGAVEVGVLIATFLYGVTTLQVFIYFSETAKVTLRMRFLVTLLWIVESLGTFFVWHYLYVLTVTHFGDTAMLYGKHWSLDTLAFLNGLAGTLVQVRALAL